MLTDTQINSFLIPKYIWEHGYSGRPDLPPIALPARDALDIERRSRKGVKLRNESHRYTLCCERMQGIVKELSYETNVLPSPIKWAELRHTDENGMLALALLAVIEVINITLRKSPYPRVAAIFFPPEDAKMHFQVYVAMQRQPNIDEVFTRAASIATLSLRDGISLKKEVCETVFYERLEMLKSAFNNSSGIVDVMEIV